MIEERIFAMYFQNSRAMVRIRRRPSIYAVGMWLGVILNDSVSLSQVHLA